jgi:Uma2 family endonuclease
MPLPQIHLGGIIAPDELKGAPDLVIEILSPGPAARDRDIKRRL